jgi:hypothetical protein
MERLPFNHVQTQSRAKKLPCASIEFMDIYELPKYHKFKVYGEAQFKVKA